MVLNIKKPEVDTKIEQPDLGEELKPKPDCEICSGKGYVECAGMKIAECTCKFK